MATTGFYCIQGINDGGYVTCEDWCDDEGAALKSAKALAAVTYFEDLAVVRVMTVDGELVWSSDPAFVC